MPQLPPVIRPPRLQPGDRVRIVSMSGTFPKKMWAGATTFCEALELRHTIGKSMSVDPGYIGRDPKKRADDFNSAVADPDTRGIFLFLGGNSAAEVLRHIDFDALRRSPKVVAGFSDHSSVVSAVYARARVVSFLVAPFHMGPLRGARARWSIDSFRTLAMEGRSGVEMPDFQSETWQKGHARGPIAAANLAIFRNLLGTPFAPELHGHILAWEEIGEEIQDINTIFTQLANAGAFDTIAGMVVGHLEQVKRKEDGYTVRDLLLRQLPKARPVLKTGAFGHFRPCFTLPLGAMASLDATLKTLVIEESAVE